MLFTLLATKVLNSADCSRDRNKMTIELDQQRLWLRLGNEPMMLFGYPDNNKDAIISRVIPTMGAVRAFKGITIDFEYNRQVLLTISSSEHA